MSSSKPAKALRTIVIAAVPNAKPNNAVSDINLMAPSLPREKKYFLARNVEKEPNCEIIVLGSRLHRAIDGQYSLHTLSYRPQRRQG